MVGQRVASVQLRRESLALSFAALCWAGNFIAGRALRHDIYPALLTLLRWSLAALYVAVARRQGVAR